MVFVPVVLQGSLGASDKLALFAGVTPPQAVHRVHVVSQRLDALSHKCALVTGVFATAKTVLSVAVCFVGLRLGVGKLTEDAGLRLLKGCLCGFFSHVHGFYVPVQFGQVFANIIAAGARKVIAAKSMYMFSVRTVLAESCVGEIAECAAQ